MQKKLVQICVGGLCALSLIFNSGGNIFLTSAEEVEAYTQQTEWLAAKSAILFCANNNQIVHQKNAYEKLPMASTTKIMTSLLVAEEVKRNDASVFVTPEMVEVEGSSMGLRPGEILPLSSLAKGMLTLSGNDAANSAAIILGGSLPGFAKMMNEKAAQIGMKDTNFVTPSGLGDPDHYSTAYDMALLGARAVENEIFLNICSKVLVETPYIYPKKTVSLKNKNKLLKRYPGCIGIKTGFTRKAGRCLVSCAEREGLRFVAVTLNSSNDWNDHAQLFDYGFGTLKLEKVSAAKDLEVQVVGGCKQTVLAKIFNQGKVVLDKDLDPSLIEVEYQVEDFLYAPINQDQEIGTAIYKIGEKVVGKNSILAAEEIEKQEKKGFISRFFKFVIGIFK